MGPPFRLRRGASTDRDTLVKLITHPDHDFPIGQATDKNALNKNAATQKNRSEHGEIPIYKLIG